MARYRRSSVLVRQGIMLVTLPLLLAGSGYALFSQNLSLATTTRNVSYTSLINAAVKYTKTVTTQGSEQIYTINPMTVYNRGSQAYDTWQVRFDLPADATQFTCDTAVVCSQAGTTMTISNGAANGAIAAGGNTSFSFTFKSAGAFYSLENISATGHLPATWQTIAGLTVTASAGTRSKSKPYTWPLTVSVKNSSAQAISGWRVTITPWVASYTMSGLPANVTYVSNGTSLVLTGTNAINNGGTTYSFTATVNSNSNAINAWSVSSATVEGKL